MIPVSLDKMDQAAIESLRDQAIPEGRTLDYKRDLPIKNGKLDDEIVEDVVALANANGGDIVYGVSEKRYGQKKLNVPEEIVGVPELTASDGPTVVSQIENKLRDSISPRLPALHLRMVGVFSRGPVLVVRVGNSFVGPHMITLGRCKFYTRNSVGKCEMDMHEIRSAFLATGSLPEQLRKFRASRLDLLINERSARTPMGSRYVAIHLVPLSALGIGISVDVVEAKRKHAELLRPVKSSGWDARMNADGVIAFAGHDPRDDKSLQCTSFVQLFRNGSIESVSSSIFPIQGHDGISIAAFEDHLKVAIGNHLSLYRALGVPAPVYLMLTLVNVRGMRLVFGPHFSGSEGTIDRDVLYVDEVVVDDLEADVDTLLHPAFEIIWHSAGEDTRRTVPKR